MTPAEELVVKAERFYALAQRALNPDTKSQLARLGDDYIQQANELKGDLSTRDKPM